MLLGLCGRLGKSFDIDPVIFQFLFIIWFINSGGIVFLWYFLLNLLF